VVVETGKPLSELTEVMEVMPQALINARVPTHKKEKYMDYPEIAEAITTLTERFAGEGRVLIRPSGTEPMVRVMIEGKDKKMIEAEAKKLAELIQNIML
jgi:phosphoglucosamine mutase